MMKNHGRAARAVAAAATAAPAAPRTAATPATAPVYLGSEQAMAVQCTDDADPRHLSAHPAAAKLASARSGEIGVRDVWGDRARAQWPGNGTSDRYTGPWN